MSKYSVGEFIPLVWDQDGAPPAYYVYGHVDDRQFAAALASYYGDDFPSGDLTIKRSYARVIPIRTCEHDNELRDCGPGRGAFKVTVAHVREHR